MKSKISNKLTLTMVTLAIGAIMLTGIIINITLNWNFRRYLSSTEDLQNRRIVQTLSELYSEAASWSTVRLSVLHLSTTTGTQIKVYDIDEQLVADSMTSLGHGRRRHNVPEPRGNSYSYPLIYNSSTIGSVEITHVEPEGLFSTDALIFRRTVNQSMLLTILTIILAAILAGKTLACRLTAPLRSMTEAAEKLGQGELNTRVSVDGDDELSVLGETMNRMAVRLEKQTTMRKKLTGDISHELRTPLTTIQSYTEAFLDKIIPADEQNLRLVLEETNRLGQLVNDLQELTQAECRDRKVSMETVDLNEIVAREVERSRPLFSQKDLHLSFDRPSTTIIAFADRMMLERVLSNLLVNAWKYTPHGGNIRLTTFSEGNSAGFTVADNGTGIEPEHLPYIFERFYRVDPSRTRTTGGTGIGLAIVLENIQSMGGSIEVDSAPGKGSTFRVTLQANNL